MNNTKKYAVLKSAGENEFTVAKVGSCVVFQKFSM